MTMYNPSRFHVTDDSVIAELINRYNFATILVSPKAGEIAVSHLPLIMTNGASEKLLVGHMARANPQWKLFQPDQSVKVIFHGPHAYVSPRWYVPAADNVPTWNYGVVHVDGVARVVSNTDAAYERMTELVAKHDPEWPLALNDKDRKERMAGIVVFEIAISKINAKFKLSQNQVEHNRANVVKELLASSDQVDREAGAFMKLFEGGQLFHGTG